jgi:hypothetical protein
MSNLHKKRRGWETRTLPSLCRHTLRVEASASRRKQRLYHPSISEFKLEKQESPVRRTFVPNPMAQTPPNFGLLSYPNDRRVERKDLLCSMRGPGGRNAMNGKIFRGFFVPQESACRTRLSSSGCPNHPLTLRFVNLEPKLKATTRFPVFCPTSRSPTDLLNHAPHDPCFRSGHGFVLLVRTSP